MSNTTQVINNQVSAKKSASKETRSKAKKSESNTVPDLGKTAAAEIHEFETQPLDPAITAPTTSNSNEEAASSKKSFLDKLYDIGQNLNETATEFIVKVEERLGVDQLVDHLNVLKEKKPEGSEGATGAEQSSEHPVLDIFKFSDYRAFLKSYYLFEKARNKGFSFRYFAKKASLRSPNYLKLIIDGKRNLTNEMIFKFAKAIGLTGSRFDYFENMVLFNQAKNNEEKEYYSFRLKSKSQPVVTTQLTTEQLQVLGRWYASAICEMSKSPSFKSDADWIAQRLLGAVSTDEIEQTVQMMLECKLLHKEANGQVKPNFEVISKENFNSLFARKSVKTMMKKGLDLFEVLPREQRKYYTHTFLLPVDKFEYMQDKIRAFERDMIQESVRLYRQMDPNTSVKVYQYNSQMFPLTKNVDPNS